ILGYESVQEFMQKSFEERFEEDLRRGAIMDEEGHTITAPDQLPGSLALRGEEPPAQVMRYRQPGGQVRWLVSMVTPVFNEEGGVQLIISIVRDITESRKAEGALRTRARQQAAVADISKRALAEADLAALMDEAVAVVSRTLDVEYCKVLELLPDGEELLLRAGVGWEEGIVGQATVGAHLESQAGYTLASDEPVVSEDLNVETRFSGPPLLQQHGVVSGMSVIIRGYDRPYGVLGAHTTRRHEFSQDDVNFLRTVSNVIATAIERRRSEEWMRFQSHLLSQVETAVISTDLEGKVNYWNEHAEKLYGYTREEALDRNIMELTVGPSEAEVADEIMEYLRAGKTWEGEFVTRRKDGSAFQAHVVDSLVYDASGQATGIVGVSTDITERKGAEEALMEIRDAERRRIARDLHDLVLQDLASLIQSMQAAQIKSGTEVDTTYNEEVDILRRATKTMRETIFDLRSEASKSLVRNIESLVEHNRQMEEREVTLEVQKDFPEDLTERVSIELSRVVQEALVNVRRHSDADGVTVSLRIQDGEVRVEVSDDGQGFDTITGENNIGLSSMKERIALLGGELEVSSHPGEGTTVRATIPGPLNLAPGFQG
ncbi:MAG: PAS domain S-box protein, partial [Rubrobacteraceae bacterium]